MVKRKKHPDAPKAALSAYMLFCKEKRGALTKSNPDLKAKQVLSELGKMWREIETKEKKEFEEKAKKDKERYTKAKEKFLETHESLYLEEEPVRKRSRRRAARAAV